MDIIHKFKCNFSVQKDQRASIVYKQWGFRVYVQYNKTFVSNILPRIIAFYFNHLHVRIVDDFSQGRSFQ